MAFALLKSSYNIYLVRLTFAGLRGPTVRNYSFLFMRTFFFGAPKFVINGIKVCVFPAF